MALRALAVQPPAERGAGCLGSQPHAPPPNARSVAVRQGALGADSHHVTAAAHLAASLLRDGGGASSWDWLDLGGGAQPLRRRERRLGLKGAGRSCEELLNRAALGSAVRAAGAGEGGPAGAFVLHFFCIQEIA